MKSTIAVPVLSMLLLASSLHAYEPYLYDGIGEAPFGDPIYPPIAARTAASAPVEFRTNDLAVLGDPNGDGKAETTRLLSAAEKTRLYRLVVESLGYWNNVRSSWISTRPSGTVADSTYRTARAVILVTLVDTNGYSGVAWSGLDRGYRIPLGIGISLPFFSRSTDEVVRTTVIHEIGHALGLRHSSCDRELTRNARFGNVDSLGAFMSYQRMDGRPELHPDDIAGATYLCPEPSATTQLGEITGELVDAAGRAIFGGNVFAVDSRNRADVARLSGHSGFQGLSARHGKFRLTGLAPGSYTLVAASLSDSTYRIGARPVYGSWDNLLQTSFRPAVRTQVTVYAGRSTDLGRILEGSEGPAAPDGVLLAWEPYPGFSTYGVQLSRVEGAGPHPTIFAGPVTGTSIRRPLADGLYFLSISISNTRAIRGIEVRQLTIRSGRLAEGDTVQFSWQSLPGAAQYGVFVWDLTRGRLALSRVRTVASSGALPLENGRHQAVLSAGTRELERKILRVGPLASAPPLLVAADRVDGRAGQPLSLSFSASDPLGGPVRATLREAPAGMQVSSDRILWNNPLAGTHSVDLVATNEVGRTATRRIQFTIQAPPAYRIQLAWTRLDADRYYLVALYSLTEGRWLIGRYQTANSLSTVLPPGVYYSYAYGYGSYGCRGVGSTTFRVDAAKTVSLTR